MGAAVLPLTCTGYIVNHKPDYRDLISEMNPVQKWSYTTNSLAFRKLFELAVRAVDEIFVRDPQYPGTDMPVTGFEVFFENGDYTEKTYMVRPDEFSACFAILKKMVPNCELIPWTLQTSEDYEKKRL